MRYGLEYRVQVLGFRAYEFIVLSNEYKFISSTYNLTYCAARSSKRRLLQTLRTKP